MQYTPSYSYQSVSAVLLISY